MLISLSGLLVALLELHWNKEVKIAANIFELGSKRFGEEVDFVSKHLDFLLTNNDESSEPQVHNVYTVTEPVLRCKIGIRAYYQQNSSRTSKAAMAALGGVRVHLRRAGIYTEAGHTFGGSIP